MLITPTESEGELGKGKMKSSIIIVNPGIF